ncbi:alpha/beta fold hydrolase [Streptomyces sp. NPDC004244]
MRGIDTTRLAAFTTRWKGPLAAAGGGASLLVGIYSDEARAMLAWTWTRVAAGGTLIAAGVAAVFCTAWWARGRVERRRETQREVTLQSFEIRADDFDGDLPSDQAVIGRELRYLERRTSSTHLVVLLHGLGLDAEDFRPYMNRARQHTVAITAFGHNADEARDHRYGPIGLATHADLINGAINNLCRQYPNKKLTLVGFSVGADMLFRLAALWTAYPDRKPKVAAALLLDPNINHSTMIITGSVAQMNPDDPLAELKRIANTPRSPVEFQNVCEYLHKITEKDLHQVQRYASELWTDWEPEGRYDLFFRRFDQLQALSGIVKVFFSTHFERHFNDVVGLARQRGVRRVFDLRRVDHFELCKETFLVREVDALTRRR